MTRKRGWLPSLGVLATLALPLGALAQVRVGIEFQVNTYTPGYQSLPSLAMDGDGDFVVVWESNPQDGSLYGVFGRRFSSAGTPLASEFQVNTYTPGYQRLPTVAVRADGAFVVTWNSTDQDGSSLGVFARRFSAAGVPLASEFQVNNRTAGAQRDATLDFEATGEFVIAWESLDQDGSNYGVFARRFSAAGDAVDVEFQINTYTTAAQRAPSLTMNTIGQFVIVWQSYHQDGANDGIFGRRMTEDFGTSFATEFAVNRYTSGAQRAPSVARDFTGTADFVVAWQSDLQDGGNDGVFVEHFQNGYPVATEFQVNTYTASNQRSPSLDMDAAGGFVVAWNSDLQDGNSWGIFARRFSSVGAPVTGEFQVNTYTTNLQLAPSVGVSAGRLVVVWESVLQDGSGIGIFAQRFAFPLGLDIDGNGSVEALTDTLLALRYAFGFRGLTLTNGAVGAGCTRCQSGVIEDYLESLTN